MGLTKSELLTERLLGNTFLSLYVKSNPQIQAEGEPNAVELCDVLISFLGIAILIEVKEFDPKTGSSKSNYWLHNKVLYRARKQLTGSCAFLRRRHTVFDKKTKRIIPTSSWEAIMTVIVFERRDIDEYSYIRALPDDKKFCGVNIFSMEDFRLATEHIPTPLDFFRYLEKRYLMMKGGDHLYSFAQTPKGVRLLTDPNLTDEKILIYDYLLNNTKYYNGNILPARAIIKSAEKLSRQNVDIELLHVLSCIDLKLAEDIVEIRDGLIANAAENELTWNGQFVQSGFNEGKIGIAIAYSKLPSVTILNFDKLEKTLRQNSMEYHIETIYVMIFHDENIFELRKVR